MLEVALNIIEFNRGSSSVKYHLGHEGNINSKNG